MGLPATKWMAELGAFALRSDTELLLKSRRVVPGRLLDEGFTFERRVAGGRRRPRTARPRRTGRRLSRPRGAPSPRVQHQADADHHQPAAAIRGAPNRSLKNRAPIAAPTMIEDSRSAAIGASGGPGLRPEDQAVRGDGQRAPQQAARGERASGAAVHPGGRERVGGDGSPSRIISQAM